MSFFAAIEHSAVCAGFKKMVIFLGIAAVGLLLISLPLFSQGNAGRISGTVTDQTGSAIAGAMVTVTDSQRGIARSLTTDESGAYSAPNLIPGTYIVRTEARGFQAFERQNVLLEVGGNIRVDVQLKPGEVTQTVTVTEALPLVETTNAELGGTLAAEIIADLPLNGGNFMKLLDLRPGVTTYPGNPVYAASTNGLRGRDSVYMVDGTFATDPYMGNSIVNSSLAAGDAGTILPIEAIDEFKTTENPRAEYGWKPGSTTNVGIKSGTNSFHGTAFARGRDGSWDARNYFNPAPQPVAPVAVEEFGASLGGPIKKDKLFFFLTFGEQRFTLGSTLNITEPITAAGIGNATNNWLMACQAALDVGAPGSTTLGSLTALSAQMAGISVGPVATGHPYGTCVPAANYPGLWPVNPGTNPTGLGTIWMPNGLNNTNRIDSGLGKVDYHLNDKHSFNGLYFISPAYGITNDGAGQTNPIWESEEYSRSQVFAFNWTWTPNASWVNEVRVGYSHLVQGYIDTDKGNPANYSFTGATGTTAAYHYYTGVTNPLYVGFPSVSIAGFGAALGGRTPKIIGPDSVLTFLDHVSYLHGKHAFKFGGEVLLNKSYSVITGSVTGPVAFDQLADFFTGFPNGPCGVSAPAGYTAFPGYPVSTGITSCPGGGSASISVGDQSRNFTFQGYALFIQDDWRLTPRLTLNLGLRYEIDTVPKEQNNLQGNFFPGSLSGLAQVGSGETAPFNGDHNNFSPRLGIAWDVFGDGKTVLRAGGSLIYEMFTLDALNANIGLRGIPTGAALYGNGIRVPNPGNIPIVNLSFSNTPVINNYGAGDIPFQWGNNGPNNPIFSTTPACGDGTVTLPNGFVPQPCGVMFVDPNLRTPYVSTWTLGIQRAITRNVALDVAYVGNHGTKLLGALDINQPVAVTLPNVANGVGTVTVGSGYTAAILAKCALTPSVSNCKPNGALEQAARPYASQYPYFSNINKYGNFDVSNYNALQAALTARNYHGLTTTVGYTYSHSLGEASDQGPASSRSTFLPINSYGNLHDQLYTNTNSDIRHNLTISGTYAIPGKKGFGQMLEGWSLQTTAVLQTGLPWGVADTTTDFAGTGEQTGNSQGSEGSQWDYLNASGSPANPNAFTPNHNYDFPVPAGAANVPGVPYYTGKTNATCLALATAGGPLQVASLANLGCYALNGAYLIPPPYGGYGTQPRFQWRDHGFRNWDLSVSKAARIKERLTVQFRAEIFNVLNHPIFSNPYGAGSGINPSKVGQNGTGFGYVTATPDVESTNPVFGSGSNRDLQLGLKLSF